VRAFFSCASTHIRGTANKNLTSTTIVYVSYPAHRLPVASQANESNHSSCRAVPIPVCQAERILARCRSLPPVRPPPLLRRPVRPDEIPTATHFSLSFSSGHRASTRIACSCSLSCPPAPLVPPPPRSSQAPVALAPPPLPDTGHAGKLKQLSPCSLHWRGVICCLLALLPATCSTE
jgi:hypothetical protein